MPTRVYSFAELRTLVKYVRDMANAILAELHTIEKYRNTQVNADVEDYATLMVSLDAFISNLDYMRDDAGGQLTALELTLWDRLIEANIDTAVNVQFFDITNHATCTISITLVTPLTAVFQDGDVIEIISCSNPDYNGTHTIDTFSAGDTITLTEPVLSGTALTVSSLTRVSTTATAQTSTDHGWATGDWVLIAGAAESDYNGYFQITVTATDTFTYTVSGSPSSPATGSISAQLEAADVSQDEGMKIRLYSR